ncbi:hypothetical protein C8R44DRAFT_595781, partial [Mycena epipterygia]
STDNLQTWDIIPGRAMLIEIETHVKDEKLTVLGVYAPNAPGENAEFWETLREFFQNNPTIPKPDMMAGDTNIVEEAIDRLPCHTDPEPATTQLDLLLTALRLVDGWRKTYPTTRAYTYAQIRHGGGGSQSRIDRIYIQRDKYAQAYDWQMKTVGISTDHRMVSVRITQEGAPTTGPGRWVWLQHINRDKILVKFIHDRGTETLAAVERAANWPERDPESDIQMLWAKFQTEIREKARERSKILIPKAEKEIEDLENDLETTLNNPTLSEEEVKLSAAILTERLAKIHVDKHEKSRISAQIRNRLEGEIISKYWSALNKSKKPREVLRRLLKPGYDPLANTTAKFETDSQRMATIARNYHNKIQRNWGDTAPDIRDPTIDAILQKVVRIANPEQANSLRKQLTREDVELALKMSANNKAPGLNGIPYEVWRVLDSRF